MVLVNMFDISELEEVISKFKSIYKDDFIFSKNRSVSDSVENAIPKINPNDFKKGKFKNELKKIAKQKNIVNIFSSILGNNIRVSKFLDLRFNFSKIKSIGNTGWHQDVETLFSHYKDELGYDFITMWIALTKATEKNSMEILPYSHLKKKVYDTSYEFQNAELEEIVPKYKNCKTYKFSCNPGDVFFLHPYVLHRTISDGETFNRLSIDIRYLNLNFKNKVTVIAPKLRLKRLYKHLRRLAVILLDFLGIKKIIKQIVKHK